MQEQESTPHIETEADAETKAQSFEESARLDTWRAADETMYATFASNENIRPTVEYVNERGGAGALDTKRPRIGDIDVVQEATEEEEEHVDAAIARFAANDPKGAREEARAGVDHTKEVVEAAREEQNKQADIMSEFVRVFTKEFRSKILAITGGVDLLEVPNREAFVGAVNNRRAYLVPEGSEKQIADLFDTIAETHFVAGSQETFMKRGLSFGAMESYLPDDVGFVMNVAADGKSEPIYFVYGKGKEQQEEEAA